MGLTSLPLSLPIGPSGWWCDMGKIDMIINICTDQQQTRLGINRVSQTNVRIDALFRTSITKDHFYTIRTGLEGIIQINAGVSNCKDFLSISWDPKLADISVPSVILISFLADQVSNCQFGHKIAIDPQWKWQPRRDWVTRDIIDTDGLIRRNGIFSIYPIILIYCLLMRGLPVWIITWLLLFLHKN